MKRKHRHRTTKKMKRPKSVLVGPYLAKVARRQTRKHWIQQGKEGAALQVNGHTRPQCNSYASRMVCRHSNQEAISEFGILCHHCCRGWSLRLHQPKLQSFLGSFVMSKESLEERNRMQRILWLMIDGATQTPLSFQKFQRNKRQRDVVARMIQKTPVRLSTVVLVTSTISTYGFDHSINS